MAVPTMLEKRLIALIADHQELKETKTTLLDRIGLQAQRIQELEHQYRGLRRQIDELDKDRFSLKQLRDERKLVRGKLETVLARITALEQEL